METLIIGLLVSVLLLLVVLVGLVSWNIWLTYKTLVRPEAPCFAGSMPMMPRLGMVEVDSNHPSYGALSKMIAAKKAGESGEDPVKKSGQYL